ncbi:MAG: glycosyltransferase family 4 protein [Candidatus Hydrogenedentes bacterium]|jgi:glycosyltransferase involved in cell wall biosynthesis|nr:glycosyltransferase family 4 protein [Candidatus Hydrogenedentota bacterium]
MKICLLNVLHDGRDKRMYYKLARSLAEAGHEIISIAPLSNASLGQTDWVQFITVPPVNRFLDRFITIFRLIRLGRKQRAQIYIAPEPESWMAALCIKMLSRTKVVLDMHEHIPSEFSKFFPSFFRKAIEQLCIAFMRFCARFTDLIILTRDSFDVFWQGLKTPRVTVINTNHLQPLCRDIPEELSAEFAGTPTLIHQGIFGDIRGSYQLLAAMKIVREQLPDARCIVLGDYVYGDKEAFQNAIISEGLEHALIMIDRVPFEQVPAYIAVSQVGLILFQPGLPNHKLAMPHKLFDYMREAKAVIVPDFSVEIAHIVAESDCGLLVDSTSPERIADAMLYLLQNPDKAEELGHNGRVAVENKYNWQEDERRLLQAIGRLG